MTSTVIEKLTDVIKGEVIAHDDDVLSLAMALNVIRDHVTGETVGMDCRSGCYWCCYLLVAVKPYEAAAIARAVLGGGPEIQRRVREAAELVRGLDSSQRRAMRLPCPLLNADGKCGVYAIRPAACGAWTSNDRNACYSAYLGAKDGFLNRDLGQWMYYLDAKKIYERIEAETGSGRDVRDVELIGAVDFFVSNPDAFAKWANGDDVLGDFVIRRDVVESAEKDRI